MKVFIAFGYFDVINTSTIILCENRKTVKRRKEISLLEYILLQKCLIKNY